MMMNSLNLSLTDNQKLEVEMLKLLAKDAPRQELEQLIVEIFIQKSMYLNAFRSAIKQ